eukprot:NODE_3753_length_907_cov_25.215385_g3600_i0.p1 GENE.NODE_3753_length_907_cov_25.215385_g3600_i0~~NODE_3753_length_907_cov_25.215385_g3600_i0.p1  ORF type:complete len:293 (+),score=47.10 NODE_3753_length_907_cov_25.215385_g3600_i0:51-881(+)
MFSTPSSYSLNPLDGIHPAKLYAQAEHFVCPLWAQRPAQGWRLDVIKNHELAESHCVDAHPYFLFGRNPNVCDYVLEHRSISRVHFALVFHRNGSVYLVDLGSQLGTTITGRRCTPFHSCCVTPRDTIYIAESSRAYCLRAPGPSLKLPSPRRCKSEGLSAVLFHILVKHLESVNPYDRHKAPLTRTKQQAADTIHHCHRTLQQQGASPETLTKEFRAMAARVSDCQSYKAEGCLGKVRQGQLQLDMEAAAFALAVGEMTAPVDTPVGFHLFLRTC